MVFQFFTPHRPRQLRFYNNNLLKFQQLNKSRKLRNEAMFYSMIIKMYMPETGSFTSAF